MQEQILWSSRQHDQQQSAYALLAQMRQDNPNLAPSSVFRMLDALTEQGTIHRLASMAAYFICKHGDHAQGCTMAICDACGTVEERVVRAMIDDVSAEAAKAGLAPSRHVIEVYGHNAECISAEAAE